MAVTTLVPIQTQAPPDVPTVKDIPATLTDYLRRFATWSTTQLSNKIPVNTAVAGVLLVAPNGTVYKLTISNTGTVVTTSVQLGGPNPQG